jgi:hypothetical protein
MPKFDSINPKELSILASAIAIALSEGRDADELNVLGNLIVAVGSIILTIAAQEQNIKALKNAQNQDQTVK